MKKAEHVALTILISASFQNCSPTSIKNQVEDAQTDLEVDFVKQDSST